MCFMASRRCAAPVLFALFTAALPSFAHAQTPAAPPAASQTQSQTLILQHIKPSEFVRSLGQYGMATSGIVRMSPDDSKGRLLIQGTERDIAKIQEIVHLLDIKPRAAYFTVRLLRVAANAVVAEGATRVRGEVVTTANTKGENNARLALYAVGDGKFFTISVTPHINGDGSVTISMQLSDTQTAENNGAETSAAANPPRTQTRRTPNGSPVIATDLPVVTQNAKYYLEVTPQVPPRADEIAQTAQTALKTVQIAAPQAR